MLIYTIGTKTLKKDHLLLETFYEGWMDYQRQLIRAIAPLSSEQLALCAASHLRSVGLIAAHIIASRVAQFHRILGEGSAEVAPLVRWDDADQPVRTASELVNGLEITWQLMHNAIAHWTPADLGQTIQWQWQGREYTYSRPSLIWSTLKHDIHHGGELSLMLGIHGLAALE